MSVALALFAGCQNARTEKMNPEAADTADGTEVTDIIENTEIDNTIATAVFDIDKDGKDETCVLRYGPTSGLFTFILSVRENGICRRNLQIHISADRRQHTEISSEKIHYSILPEALE